jgi:hypothetical protein
MSLRKPTSLTPARLEAARRNAQRSTGPRTQAGKQRMRMNALKHGCDAAPENEAAVMRALGEDPQRFAALKGDLMSSYGPGDTLWEQQLEDLAKLYWRRQRIERMQTGLMRRALEAIEERQRERGKQIPATFAPCHGAAMDIDLTLRKEHAQQQKEAARPPEDEPSDRAAEELSKLVGLEARSEGLAEETAAERSKVREKSQNALENKASAGQAPRTSVTIQSMKPAELRCAPADHSVPVKLTAPAPA